MLVGNFFIENPNFCPYCHTAIEAKPLFQTLDYQGERFVSIWNCTFSGCGKTFVVSQKKIDSKNFIFDRFLDGLPKGPIFPKPIIELLDANSSNENNTSQTKFIKTYLQSLVAESQGLDEIAGMGYRKAIEYLVKDWAIHKFPTDKDKIQKLWLSDIIKNYFNDDLKEILDRATWLGNDQSHYNKLFEEFNIVHLKELIDLIMVELDREFKKRHYIENIEKKK